MSGRLGKGRAPRRRWWCVAALLLALAGWRASWVRAQTGPTALPTPVPLGEPGSELFPLPSMPPGTLLEPREVPLPEFGVLDVWVELRAPSAGDMRAWAQRWGLPGSVAEGLAALQARRLGARQDALIRLLTTPPIAARVIGGAQGALNGLVIQVDARKIEAIRQLPGVESVRRLRLGTWASPPANPNRRPRAGQFPGQPVHPRAG